MTASDQSKGGVKSDDSVEHPEVVAKGGTAEGAPEAEAVEHPAKVMRIGSMIKLLLEEVRQSDLDDASRERLREIYETSVRELAEALSPDLREELGRLAHPFGSGTTPSESELRVAKAQLVGWLEGLFHGIQATLFAQQMAARQQLEEMRRRLPPGSTPDDGRGRAEARNVPVNHLERACKTRRTASPGFTGARPRVGW